MRTRSGVDTIACTEYPEPLALLVLHHEVVAHRLHLARPQPPFAEDALGSVSTNDAATLSTPGHDDGRLVGQDRHRLDLFRISQQA